jgi:hypothetical protein
MTSTVIWIVMPSSLERPDVSFEDLAFIFSIAYILTLTMEAICFSETLDCLRTKRRYTQEDRTAQYM